MSERIQRRRGARQEDEAVRPPERAAAAAAAQASDYDAILDEIDAALQTDAAAYVRSFVQKGGQ